MTKPNWRGETGADSEMVETRVHRVERRLTKIYDPSPTAPRPAYQNPSQIAALQANTGTAAGVTSVTGTAPVVSSGGTTPDISMAAATDSVPGYLTAADHTAFAAKQASITSATNALTGGGVQLTLADTFYDGPSINLTAGTWLVIGQVHVMTGNSANFITAKLWDGTTTVAAAQTASTASQYYSMPLSGIVTIATGTVAWKISCAASAAPAVKSTIRAVTANNSPGTYASVLSAIKIA